MFCEQNVNISVPDIVHSVVRSALFFVRVKRTLEQN